MAGLWGCLPGQELCSGAASQAVVALWVGPELGVCLKRKLRWAGVLSTEVSPKGSASHRSGRGVADKCSDKFLLALLLS